MRKNAKSHGWRIEAELNRVALVQLIPAFEMLLARLIALTDAMRGPLTQTLVTTEPTFANNKCNYK